jgi:aminopeptidase N
MHDAAARPFSPPGTAQIWTRPRIFRVTHIDLEFSIDLDAKRVEGVVSHHVELLPSAGDRRVIELDQHDLDIRSVEVGGTMATFSRSTGRLIIDILPQAGMSFAVRITFSSTQPAKGLYFIAPDAQLGRVAMAWTQGAMEDHSYWFPCFDSPNNLSSYRIAIRHRSEYLAVSNGLCVSRDVLGDGWSRSVYEQRDTHVVYLLNVAVGDFVAISDSSAIVPLVHYLPRGHEQCSGTMFRATAFAIAWLSDFIKVPFAWPCYGHVVVHGFMWGGMENTTLTTITDRGLMDESVAATEDVDIDSLVIHELVHQWFGDLLTMKAWSDIWLNESFATYLEARCTAVWRSSSRGSRVEDELASELWSNLQVYLEEDSGRYRRPLVTNRYLDAYELFDRVAYEKGSLVLHALCRYLGEDRFRSALSLYTARHAHDLVETADFRQAIEDATGEPLDWFFDQWIYRAGHPCIRVSWKHDPARSALIVEIDQQQALVDPEQAFRVITEIAWSEGGRVVRSRVDIDRPRNTLVLACSRAPSWVVLDPDGDIPAEWHEEADGTELIARLGDKRLPATARARAARACGRLHPAVRVIAALEETLGESDTPELVALQCIAALGSLKSSAARDVLLEIWPKTSAPRMRRALARAFAQFRLDAQLAGTLVGFAERETSQLTAGELWAARAALECPGATPVLRGQLKRSSWNQRLRQALVRGLGDCGEPAAIDEILTLLADGGQIEAVRGAALAAAAVIGSRHLIARDRVRRAIESHLDADSLMVRSAAARALGQLMDPGALPALSLRSDREVFGNVKRVIREAQERLRGAAAVTTATAALATKITDLEAARKALELRLETLEKRLLEPRPRSVSKKAASRPKRRT